MSCDEARSYVLSYKLYQVMYRPTESPATGIVSVTAACNKHCDTADYKLLVAYSVTLSVSNGANKTAHCHFEHSSQKYPPRAFTKNIIQRAI